MITEFFSTLETIMPERLAKGGRRAYSGQSGSVTFGMELVSPGFIPPSQAELLRRREDFPGRCVLLGVGADESIFHLDLENPVSGSLLILGDREPDQVALLRSMIASALTLNNEDTLHISVITHTPDEYLEFSTSPHLQEILPPDEPVTSELIREIMEEAVSRSRGNRLRGKRLLPIVLLIIENLAECLTYLDQDAYYRLYWLIRHGPRYKIWVAASLPVRKYDQAGERYLSAFRTRLLGHIRDHRLALKASQMLRLPTDLLQPNQFFVPYGDESFIFYVCPIEFDEGVQL